jgi:hypothetical protein
MKINFSLKFNLSSFLIYFYIFVLVLAPGIKILYTYYTQFYDFHPVFVIFVLGVSCSLVVFGAMYNQKKLNKAELYLIYLWSYSATPVVYLYIAQFFETPFKILLKKEIPSEKRQEIIAPVILEEKPSVDLSMISPSGPEEGVDWWYWGKIGLVIVVILGVVCLWYYYGKEGSNGGTGGSASSTGEETGRRHTLILSDEEKNRLLLQKEDFVEKRNLILTTQESILESLPKIVTKDMDLLEKTQCEQQELRHSLNLFNKHCQEEDHILIPNYNAWKYENGQHILTEELKIYLKTLQELDAKDGKTRVFNYTNIMETLKDKQLEIDKIETVLKQSEETSKLLEIFYEERPLRRDIASINLKLGVDAYDSLNDLIGQPYPKIRSESPLPASIEDLHGPISIVRPEPTPTHYSEERPRTIIWVKKGPGFVPADPNIDYKTASDTSSWNSEDEKRIWHVDDEETKDSFFED